ncbi:DNA-binding LacI/PurR family transcriptional regulator [Labedella gwakjiensis]|uniref:DNA-binding LacI/PurR family transcriptional regulator n=1 Tax=Labedella gwakjiensis TaxID=390269 RepID=A0A2P8GTI8_9MICO|nr:LacI family DNA-binding transcriptional regulator [Labedella gwakjiensis]PSL37277.1 DNA-binding LacI/PurR family transcriptional regulator [Labedella gwakjiensis]RUQ84604.1 LacI family transcriptional regulator [Labedella gwakjiensis]
MSDATIYDVAERAGVSHQTVSRFLRGFEGIRPETRAKVERALAELEYRPNSAARFLRLGRTNRIGLLADNMHQSGPARTIAGATKAARELGYVTDIVSMDGGDEASVRDALDLVLSQQIAGLVLTAQTAIARAAIDRREIEVPVARDFGLLLDGSDESLNGHAGAVAAEHLVSLGHRVVAYVSGPEQWLASRERLDGFTAATEAVGGRVAVTADGDWSAESGFEIGRRLVAAGHVTAGGGGGGVTAIAVGNDAMAMGLLAALAEAGISVPGDVSVMGNDDSPEARFMVPSLTTVALDFDSEGALVVRSLIARIEGRETDPSLHLHTPRLVLRQSTAAPRS